MDNQNTEKMNTIEQQEWKWCLVGNIVQERDYGEQHEIKSGTKHFSPGTKVLSCFERNKIVYIDLSADIINMGHNVISIKDGVELLKENILKNFPHIQEVRVFVDGKYAFE